MVDALAAQPDPFRTGPYSITGNEKILDGGHAPFIINHRKGLERFTKYDELGAVVTNLSRAVPQNVFGETWAGLVETALEDSEALGVTIDEATTNQSFVDEGLSRQLRQVARLIDARGELSSERDVFYVDISGFDTHSNLLEVQDALLAEVNTALTTFVAELKARATRLPPHTRFHPRPPHPPSAATKFTSPCRRARPGSLSRSSLCRTSGARSRATGAAPTTGGRATTSCSAATSRAGRSWASTRRRWRSGTTTRSTSAAAG